MQQPTASTGAPASVPGRVLFVIILLGSVGPFATDMYVPGFPHVAAEFRTSATLVQLTLTTFFVGMGLGQLCGGPISDQYGRKWPMLAGSTLMLLASIGCALSPSIGLMALFRFLQGFGGGWAMAVSRAVLVDLARGPLLVRLMNLIMGIGATAPIVAPLVGGVIQTFWVWRGAFWILAALGVLMVLSGLAWVPETLPPERRHSGGLRAFVEGARHVLANRAFVGYLVAIASSALGMFAYVATSSFVLQTINHFSPVAYSLDFAANAVGLMTATLLSARFAGRFNTRRIVNVGQVAGLCAGVAMLIGALFFGTPAWLAMICFFLLVTGQGFIGANVTALGASEVPERAGTASAVQGLVQSSAAGVAAPLAGIGGAHTAVPMALMMTVGPACSLLALLFLARHTDR